MYQASPVTLRVFNMNITDMPLKIKLLIVGLFVGFFALILFLTLNPKTRNTNTTNGNSPTKVPVVLQQNSKSTLPKSEIQTPPGLDKNSLGKITFNIPDAGLPKTATLYDISPSSIPTEVIGKIKSILVPAGIEKNIDTPRGKVTIITDNQKTLTIYSYARTITFTDTSPSSQDTSQPFVLKARSFIKSLNLSIDETDPKIAYYSTRTSDLTEASNYSTSDVIDVSFRETTNNIVVYHQFGSDSRTHVWLTKNNGVTKFTYLYPPTYSPRTSISLPTLSTAQDMVLKNRATVVSLGDEYQQGSIGDIESTIFSKVTFGYFSDSTTKALYPIFVFSGKSLAKGVSYPIVVYLPVDGSN